MHKIKLLIMLAIATKLVMALPALAIAKLSYAPGVDPSWISNADVRGAISQSGKFKVVELPQGFVVKSFSLQSDARSNVGLAATESVTNAESMASLPRTTASAAVTAVPNPSNNTPASLEDKVTYVLVGKVLASDETENPYQIKGTDKNTLTHSLAVTVSYQLVRLKDKATVASFTAYGSASQVKLISVNQDPAQIHFDRPRLVHEVSLDLAQNVLNQLLEQAAGTMRIEQRDHPVITDVKTYAD
jgi:hypothetical protein